MAVMLTESRIPAGFAPEDLGQAMIKTYSYSQPIPELGDLNPIVMKFVLISYLTSPVTQGSLNQYAIFVLDPDLVSSVDSYQWEVYKSVEGSLFPALVCTATSQEGVFEYTPVDIGEQTLIVRLRNAAGQVLDSIEMRQAVIPFSEAFNAMLSGLSTTIYRLWSRHVPDIEIGNAISTNELANDFYRYIQDSVEEPINGETNMIPWQLLAAIAYREMFFAPKESPMGMNWHKPNRTTELFLYRNLLNGTSSGPWGMFDIEGASLGVCQIQPQTLATVLLNPGTGTTPYTPFLEEDTVINDGELLAENRLNAYLGLNTNDRVDLFNLLRFPKSHLRMCNIVLQKLKNRTHRYPSLDAEELLADSKALQVIATEYNQGPTTTPRDCVNPGDRCVGPNDYGREVYTIITSPMMAALPTLTNLIPELWGVVMGSNGSPVVDARVDLYETMLKPATALKFWKYKEDFKDPTAPFEFLDVEEEYRVLETARNFPNGNQTLDLVKVSVQTSLWDKEEGWVIARDGGAYYAYLYAVRSQEVARTDEMGRFRIVYTDTAPVKLRFVKDPDAAGNGYFDGESAWGTAPNYYRVVMQAASHMVREADILALLPDWEAYVYSGAWAANYPNHYYLGSNNDSLRGFDLDEPPGLEIACNGFTQAIITEAWFRKYPQLRWNKDNWSGFIIENVWDTVNNQVGFDPFGPMTETLRGDGSIAMSVLVDASENRPPPRWSLIQGWSKWDPVKHATENRAADGSIGGHSFIIVDHHPGTDKILTIEANHGLSLNGIGMRCLGNISGQKHAGIITPNKDRLWIEKAAPTWQETKQNYNELVDSAHNPNNRDNPVGIARLKVYDLQWSGAEVL